MTARAFELSQRTALRQLRARHLISLGAKLVNLFDQKRPKGVYQLLQGDALWVQTTHTLETVFYRLPPEPDDWDHSRWQRQPMAIDAAPVGFESSSTTLPFWLYAQVTEKLHLPKTHRELPLWLTAFPDLPFRFIKDRQLALMGQLVARPATLQELQTEHPEHGTRLECDLLALVWSGHLQVLPDD